MDVSRHPLVQAKRHRELYPPFGAGFRAPPDQTFQRSDIQFGVAGLLENPDPGNLTSLVEIYAVHSHPGMMKPACDLGIIEFGSLDEPGASLSRTDVYIGLWRGGRE